MKLDNNTTDIYFRNNDTDRVYYGEILIWEKIKGDTIILSFTTHDKSYDQLYELYYTYDNDKLGSNPIYIDDNLSDYNSSTNSYSGKFQTKIISTFWEEEGFAYGFTKSFNLKRVEKLPDENILPIIHDAFDGCKELEYVDMSNITKTYKITYNLGMFCDCIKLKEIKFGNFDASNVTASVFFNCDSLTTISGNINNLGKGEGFEHFFIKDSTDLTRNSAMVIINGLISTSSKYDMVISESLYNRLSSTDIAVATSKGWTVSVY